MCLLWWWKNKATKFTLSYDKGKLFYNTRLSFAERIYLPHGYKSLFSAVPPQIVTVEEDFTYGISEYSVHVKIPEVASNFFDDLLNFSTPDSVLHIQNLSYNINYSFKIVAVNCFGVENTTQLEILH